MGACREVTAAGIRSAPFSKRPSDLGATCSALVRRKFLSMLRSFSLVPLLRRKLSLSMELLLRRPSLSKLCLAALRACTAHKVYRITHTPCWIATLCDCDALSAYLLLLPMFQYMVVAGVS